jgi:hypothetical protein
MGSYLSFLEIYFNTRNKLGIKSPRDLPDQLKSQKIRYYRRKQLLKLFDNERTIKKC